MNDKPLPPPHPYSQKPKAIDRQEGGSHYKNFEIQPIEFILSNRIPFCEGNIIKYICRWKNKNGIEDLKKAKHYIEMLIEHAEVEM